MSDKKKVIKKPAKAKLINRELSWLSFNQRVLQEAADPEVPLLERIKFLGIFSNNLDEFFRVRVAEVKRIATLKNAGLPEKAAAKKLLEKIKETVIFQQMEFDRIYQKEIIPELAQNGIDIISEKELTINEETEVRQYFENVVTHKLHPLMLSEDKEIPALRDGNIYLAIKLSNTVTKNVQYALVGLPTNTVGRFYILPESEGRTKVVLLDDIIRASLDLLFKSLDFNRYTAHTIKLTRDAELDFDSDLRESILEKLEKSLKLRKKGVPTRFLYDGKIPLDLLKFLEKKLKVEKESSIPGGRYHNFRDFMKFPQVGYRGLLEVKPSPMRVSALDSAKSLLNEISKRDILLSYPYQSFDYIIRLLRESAIDPSVFSIKITLYRVAENSNIADALINAVHNGKHVTVVMELRARFMEEHNMHWANRLRDEGAHVIHGVPNHKVHSKLIVISRRNKFETENIVHIGTGNFNEDTARIYADHSLLTSRKRIATEALKIFDLIQNFKPEKFKFNALWVSPINTRQQFLHHLNREIKHAKLGKPARAIIKVNSLVDEEMCYAIMHAAKQGVKIDLIVRGICCLPLKGNEPNIRAISIVDRYLEHARIFYFENAGKYEIFMGSADLMRRNLDFRVEATVPILDKYNKKTLKAVLECQLSGNVKARILEKKMKNEYVRKDETSKKYRVQEEMYSVTAV